MNTKRPGSADLFITPIGFGAWAIGGSGWEFAWGAQDDNNSIAAIRAALDAGVSWIDTAAVYGLGHSEEIGARGRNRRWDPRPTKAVVSDVLYGAPLCPEVTCATSSTPIWQVPNGRRLWPGYRSLWNRQPGDVAELLLAPWLEYRS